MLPEKGGEGPHGLRTARQTCAGRRECRQSLVRFVSVSESPLWYPHPRLDEVLRSLRRNPKQVLPCVDLDGGRLWIEGEDVAAGSRHTPGLVDLCTDDGRRPDLVALGDTTSNIRVG